MATPEQITAGLNAGWTVESSDYPASDGWNITYDLVNAAAHVTFTSSAVDGVHKVALAAATTTGYAAGLYSYQAIAKKGSDSYLVDSGFITILASFGAAHDTRPHCKKVLDAIETLLEGKAVKDVSSYMIGSRRLDHYPIPDLLVFREKYMAEWRRWKSAEKLRLGLGGGGNILVRF